MPGSRVRPGGSAGAASACPATVSWSVSAMTSRPAAAALAITSAGGVGAVGGVAVAVQIGVKDHAATLAGQVR